MISVCDAEAPPNVPLEEAWALIEKGLEIQRTEAVTNLRNLDTAITLIKTTRDRMNRGEILPLAAQSNRFNDGGNKIDGKFFQLLNVPEAVILFFSATKRSASHGEIVAALKTGGQRSAIGKHFGVVVFNALTRLQKRKFVTRVDRQWGLTEWCQPMHIARFGNLPGDTVNDKKA